MSHQISKNLATGLDQCFTAGEKAWHGLGINIPERATLEEALVYAGLDYDVLKQPVMIDVNGTQVQYDNQYGVYIDYGDGNIVPLGVVGKDHTIVQNKDSFRFFDEIVGKGEAAFEVAGALGKGERTWILAKMPEVFEAIKGDPIEDYILLYNHHYKGSVVACLTDTRVVCNNTVRMALGGTKFQIDIRHTKNVLSNLSEAGRVMNMYLEGAKVKKDFYKQLAKTKMRQSQVEKFFNAMNPRNPDTKMITEGDKNKALWLEIYEGGAGSDIKGVRGSAYGALQAITNWTSHRNDLGGKAISQGFDQQYADQATLNSLWFGVGQRTTENAIRLLNGFMDRGEVFFDDEIAKVLNRKQKNAKKAKAAGKGLVSDGIVIKAR